MAFGLYAANPSTNFHENYCNIYIYILYKLYIVCCVGRVEIQIEQTDKQTEVKTEVIINGNDNGD